MKRLFLPILAALLVGCASFAPPQDKAFIEGWNAGFDDAVFFIKHKPTNWAELPEAEQEALINAEYKRLRKASHVEWRQAH